MLFCSPRSIDVVRRQSSKSPIGTVCRDRCLVPFRKSDRALPKTIAKCRQKKLPWDRRRHARLRYDPSNPSKLPRTWDWACNQHSTLRPSNKYPWEDAKFPFRTPLSKKVEPNVRHVFSTGTWTRYEYLFCLTATYRSIHWRTLSSEMTRVSEYVIGLSVDKPGVHLPATLCPSGTVSRSFPKT